MLHKILVLLLSSPIINYHFSFKEVKNGNDESIIFNF